MTEHPYHVPTLTKRTKSWQFCLGNSSTYFLTSRNTIKAKTCNVYPLCSL